MSLLAETKKPGVNSKTILQRIAEKDQTAVNACVADYGNVIWTMALKCTASKKEAENVVREIFLDIWRFAGRFEGADVSERIFITLIARRRLINCSRAVKQPI